MEPLEQQLTKEEILDGGFHHQEIGRVKIHFIEDGSGVTIGAETSDGKTIDLQLSVSEILG